MLRSKESCFRFVKQQLLTIDRSLQTGQRSIHQLQKSLNAIVIYNAFDPVSGMGVRQGVAMDCVKYR
jgi:hypothetical protein